MRPRPSVPCAERSASGPRTGYCNTLVAMRGGSGLGWLRGTALDLVERKRLDGPHKDGKITRPRACVAEVLHPFHGDHSFSNSRPMGWKLVLRKPVWGQRVVIDVNRRRRRDPSSYAPMCATEDCPLLSMTDLWCCFWADAGIGRCGGLQGSPWLTVG